MVSQEALGLGPVSGVKQLAVQLKAVQADVATLRAAIAGVEAKSIANAADIQRHDTALQSMEAALADLKNPLHPSQPRLPPPRAQPLARPGGAPAGPATPHRGHVDNRPAWVAVATRGMGRPVAVAPVPVRGNVQVPQLTDEGCLLYTSDAADD